MNIMENELENQKQIAASHVTQMKSNQNKSKLKDEGEIQQIQARKWEIFYINRSFEERFKEIESTVPKHNHSAGRNQEACGTDLRITVK